MICRVAESCFWLTRYVERVATLARLLEVNNSFQLDVHLTAGRGVAADRDRRRGRRSTSSSTSARPRSTTARRCRST